METLSKRVRTSLRLLWPDSHDMPNRFGNRQGAGKRMRRMRVTVGIIAVFLLIVVVITVAVEMIAEATDYFAAEAAA